MIIPIRYNPKFWLLALGDLFLALTATKLAQWIRFGRYYDIFSAETGASLLSISMYMVMLYVFDLYHVGRSSRSKEFAGRLAMAVVVAGFLSIALFYLLPQYQFGRGVFVLQMLFAWLLFFTWHLLFTRIFIDAPHQEEVLLVGAGAAGQELFQLLASSSSPYKVVGFIDDEPPKNMSDLAGMAAILGGTDDIVEIAASRDINTIISALTENQPARVVRNLLRARLRGIAVLKDVAIYERLTVNIPVQHIQDEWLLFAEGFDLLSKQYVKKVKRLFDFWATLLIFILASPVMLITMLAIKLDSPGPVFYKQKRVGLHGRVFDLLKLRSMRQNVEEDGAVWAQKNDPRVTRVGRIIRVLRIDELPQLLNVLRREMSLIGPRPERPEFTQVLEARIPYYYIRHSVLPGITGWAQVNYSYGASEEDALHKLEYDLYYIKNMSIGLDIRILMKTVGVVLFGQGAR